MVSTNTLCKKLLNVKSAVIEGANFYTDEDDVNHILIHARPNVWHEDDCPFCHKRCRRTTRRTLIHVSGVGWTGVVLSLKYLMTRTALNVPNMACLQQMSHGLVPVAALRRTSTLLWGGLQHTCLEALSLNICVLTGKRSEGVSTGP